MEFVWDGGKIDANIDRLEVEVHAYARAATEYQASRGEAYMKSNAPWTDRTGAARTGLFTLAAVSPNELRIIFAHLVTYGIWLEVANSGNYQIIMPSVLKIGNDLMRQLDKAFRKM